MESGKKKTVAQQVREMALPLADGLGLVLWDVLYLKEGTDWVLRIIIDKPGGVAIDDCVDLTHAINPLLDERDLISREYSLEVTSPGANRRLTKTEHLQASIGMKIYFKLLRPSEDGAKEFTAVLVSAEEDGSFEAEIEDGRSIKAEIKECALIRRSDFE